MGKPRRTNKQGLVSKIKMDQKSVVVKQEVNTMGLTPTVVIFTIGMVILAAMLAAMNGGDEK